MRPMITPSASIAAPTMATMPNDTPVCAATAVLCGQYRVHLGLNALFRKMAAMMFAATCWRRHATTLIGFRADAAPHYRHLLGVARRASASVPI